MKILIIEDEISKEQRIIDFLHETFPSAKIIAKHSVMAGKDAINEDHFDYILLDMSLPLFDYSDVGVWHNDSNEFETFGGLAILDEMDRCRSKSKVIVITAFDILGDGKHRISLQDLDAQMKSDYQELVIKSIFYDSSSVEWREEIRSTIVQNL